MLFVCLRQTQRLRQTETTAGVFYFHDDVTAALNTEPHVDLVFVTDRVHGVRAELGEHQQRVVGDSARYAGVGQRGVDVVPNELQRRGASRQPAFVHNLHDWVRTLTG